MAEKDKGGWDSLSTQEKRVVYKRFVAIVGEDWIKGKSPEEIEETLRKWHALQEQYHKAANAQGAGEEDLDPATTGGGNPAPAEPPKNKAEAEAAEAAEAGTEPTEEEKAAAEAKAKEEAEAADKADAEEEAEDKPLDTDVWGSTGDEVGDSVLTLLQNSGLTTEDAKAMLYDAVLDGDVTKIDRAALEAKVGKDKANLILAGTENFITRSKAKAETIVKDVHTTVGGKDNWDAVTTWAKANIAEAELSEYADLIDQGGAKARFAAQELVARYNGDSNNTTLQQGTVEITGDAKAAPSGEKLTKAQYVERLEQAYAKGATEAEIAAIKAARARGRAAGI